MRFILVKKIYSKLLTHLQNLLQKKRFVRTQPSRYSRSLIICIGGTGANNGQDAPYFGGGGGGSGGQSSSPYPSGGSGGGGIIIITY